MGEVTMELIPSPHPDGTPMGEVTMELIPSPHPDGTPMGEVTMELIPSPHPDGTGDYGTVSRAPSDGERARERGFRHSASSDTPRSVS